MERVYEKLSEMEPKASQLFITAAFTNLTLGNGTLCEWNVMFLSSSNTCIQPLARATLRLLQRSRFHALPQQQFGKCAQKRLSQRF